MMIRRRFNVRMRSNLLLAVLAVVCLQFLGSTAVVGDDQSSGRPRGDVTKISDWALAGVVWSDASLAHKMALVAERQTTNEKRKAALKSEAERLEKIVKAMEQFGWKQLRRKPNPTTAEADQVTPNLSDDLDPVTQGGKRYKESVKIAEAIARGGKEGRNAGRAADNLRDASGLAEKIYTPRDGVTLSGEMPGSRNSVYELYDPGSPGVNGQLAPRANAVSTIVDNEVDNLRRQMNKTMNLPPTKISRYTKADDTVQADANWVQLQLDTNQIRWHALGNSKVTPGMLADTIAQLEARMRLASRITKNEQLKSALKQ